MLWMCFPRPFRCSRCSLRAFCRRISYTASLPHERAGRAGRCLPSSNAPSSSIRWRRPQTSQGRSPHLQGQPFTSVSEGSPVRFTIDDLFICPMLARSVGLVLHRSLTQRRSARKSPSSAWRLGKTSYLCFQQPVQLTALECVSPHRRSGPLRRYDRDALPYCGAHRCLFVGDPIGVAPIRTLALRVPNGLGDFRECDEGFCRSG